MSEYHTTDDEEKAKAQIIKEEQYIHNISVIRGSVLRGTTLRLDDFNAQLTSARESSRKRKEEDDKKKSKRSGDKRDDPANMSQTMTKLNKTGSINSNDEALM